MDTNTGLLLVVCVQLFLMWYVILQPSKQEVTPPSKELMRARKHVRYGILNFVIRNGKEFQTAPYFNQNPNSFHESADYHFGGNVAQSYFDIPSLNLSAIVTKKLDDLNLQGFFLFKVHTIKYGSPNINPTQREDYTLVMKKDFYTQHA